VTAYRHRTRQPDWPPRLAWTGLQYGTEEDGCSDHARRFNGLQGAAIGSASEMLRHALSSRGSFFDFLLVNTDQTPGCLLRIKHQLRLVRLTAL
jgi:hypothetical protein